MVFISSHKLDEPRDIWIEIKILNTESKAHEYSFGELLVMSQEEIETVLTYLRFVFIVSNLNMFLEI